MAVCFELSDPAVFAAHHPEHHQKTEHRYHVPRLRYIDKGLGLGCSENEPDDDSVTDYTVPDNPVYETDEIECSDCHEKAKFNYKDDPDTAVCPNCSHTVCEDCTK
ncbi:hypothetical protein F4778DRAFT_779642 [Xylariomycetidae sp. FL2044]|nr:hypothetical protein F4778DRAFT_779642 [Xylariomycetidae sp. FL2044]